VGEYVGARVKRREDPRLLRGAGRFVADIAFPGMLHAAVLRSPFAHASIEGIDTSAALALPGVTGVMTYDDLDGMGPLPLHVPNPALDAAMPYPLAKDEVVHVGQPVALVLAETAAIAEDALELIEVRYEELPVVVDATAALEPGSPPAHRDRATNRAARVGQEVGNVDRAFERADLIVEHELSFGRVSGQPIETRGIVAHWDESRDRERLQVWSTTQVPHTFRHILCDLLDLPSDQVRVVAPDVGGGFGIKEIFYQEDVLVPFAARRLGRPVRWIETRTEHFVSAVQEREQRHRARMALSRDGRIIGVDVIFVNDNGAFTPWGIVVPLITAQTIPGPYKVPNYRFRMDCALTNKVPLAPYRGAGRPQGTFVMERLLDRAAGELGIDRAEIRFRNFIEPDEFPYNVGLPGRDGKPLTYDSGDYPASLAAALALAGYDGADDWRGRGADGRYRGIGFGCCVEYAAPGPFESGSVAVRPDGGISVASGLSSQGQGHATVLAQLCADRLGVPLEAIEVREGDTALMPYGMGTFASRGAVMGGNAVSAAALAVREKAIRLAAELLEAAADDLTIEDGFVHVKGVPDRGYSLGDLARIMESPIPGAPMPGRLDPGLQATEYFQSTGLTYANGAHVACVAVDIETGRVEVEKYVVVHDCGRVLNPLILDGQIAGGVAQGLGNALYEEIVYDESGQLLTSSFVDYGVPSACEVPPIEISHRETPSPFNPEGLKGSGEGGTIPVPAAIASAVDDALRDFDVRITRIPIVPSTLRAAIARRRKQG